MKLYATTTSERATKGQGGNEYINIDLIADDKNHLSMGKIKMVVYEYNNINGRIAEYEARYYPPNKKGYNILYCQKVVK